jgi:hypothetical protein
LTPAQVWKRLAKIDGFAEGASIFSDDDRDRAYFVNGTQVANTDGSGGELGLTLGLRLTRKVFSAHRARLHEHPRVGRRNSSSDWITFDLDGVDKRDLALVDELAALTAHAHLPPDGTPLKPPPEGAALARRRKFH